MTSPEDNPGPPPPSGGQITPAIAAKFAEFGPNYRLFAVITAMVGTLATLLPATIVNVMIPEIMGAFGIGQDKAQWLATGFLASSTITMLANSWMVHSFGARFTFVSSLCLFLLGSVAGMFAPNEDFLIAIRVFQGAAAGIMTPLTMMIMFQVFPPEQRGRAMGIFAMGAVMAPALGPSVGGLVIDTLGWRYIFFLEVPLLIAAIAMGSLFLIDREATGPREKFDWTGLILVSISVSTLLIGLTEGQKNGWHENFVLFCLITAGVSFVVFITWELIVAQPLLQLRVFLQPSFAPAAIVMFVFGGGLYGSTYLAPLFLQTVQGSTALSAGLLLMPPGLIMLFVFPLAGFMSDRLSPTIPMVLGLVLFSFSCYLMTGMDLNAPFVTITIWIMVGRVGLGMCMPSLTAASMGAMPMHLIAQASGINNFVRQLGGAFGVNIVSVILAQRTNFFLEAMTSTQTAANTATLELLEKFSGVFDMAGLTELTQEETALFYLGRMIYSQAYMLAFRDCFLILTFVFLLAIIPGLLIRKKKAAPAAAAPPMGQLAPAAAGE
ncbi:MAG: DHA2 family efflux MFS transporter permease subunit [Alphaproteobacteria bacterium]